MSTKKSSFAIRQRSKTSANCRSPQPAEVVAAVERGREAQAIWQQTSFAQRAQLLYRLRDLLLDEGEKLADILTAETGRPRAEVYGNELFYLCDAIGIWAKKSAAYLRPEKIRPHFPLLKAKKVISTYAPRGVIGIISPWNFPLTLTLGEAIPALMAGNAVVIKPSELTPLSAIFGAEIAAKAGFPENLLQVVVGYGETGEALIDHADMIAFTGSVETGKQVMRRAAERLIPVSLELGGKDPMIVLKDADLDRAAGACVWGALMNCGQICTSIERVYVEAPVYQQFVDKIVARVRAIRQGPSEDEVEIGCMTSEAQLKKVAAQVDEAVRRRRQSADRRPAQSEFAGLLLRAHGAGRRRSFDEHHDGGNLRPDHSDREGQGCRGGAALGERLPLWSERQHFCRRPSAGATASRRNAKRLGLHQR